MKGVVSTESLDLKTELGNLSLLVDEAVDYLAESGQSSPMLTAATGDLKEVILNTVMSRMMAGPVHGSTQEQEVGEVLSDSTQNE